MEPSTFSLPTGALHPLTKDEHDFKVLGGVFNVPKLEDLPEEFYNAELMGVKDQGNKDFCAGYASAAVSEDQEAVELNPEYSFMVAKRLLMEKDPEAWRSWGVDLRTMAQGAVKVGFLEQNDFPFAADDRRDDRDFLANPANWPAELDLLAATHKKGSFWDASEGPYDLFDNLRATIWMNRYEARSILTGCLFRWDWMRARGGVIPKEYGATGEGHAIKAFGWKKIDDEVHLVIVNSWGLDAGDSGLFYFPREVVNKEFTYGAYTYRDMTKEDAQTYIETGIKPADKWYVKLWKVVKLWIKNLITK